MFIGKQKHQELKSQDDQFINQPPFGLHVRLQGLPFVSPSFLKAKKKKGAIPSAIITTVARIDYLADVEDMIEAMKYRATEKLNMMLDTGRYESSTFEVVHYLTSEHFLTRMAVSLVPGQRDPKFLGDPNRN